MRSLFPLDTEEMSLKCPIEHAISCLSDVYILLIQMCVLSSRWSRNVTEVWSGCIEWLTIKWHFLVFWFYTSHVVLPYIVFFSSTYNFYSLLSECTVKYEAWIVRPSISIHVHKRKDKLFTFHFHLQ